MEDQEPKLEATVPDTVVAEPQKDQPKSKLALQGFESKLLEKKATDFHFTGNSFDAFKPQFMNLDETELRDAITLVVSGEKLTQQQQKAVQKELMRRQLAQVWPKISEFTGKLTAQGGEVAELIGRAMKDGKPEMLSFILLQAALHSEKSGDGEKSGEVQLANGHDIHEFQERMSGKNVKEIDPESDRMAFAALQMAKLFGFGKVSLDDDSIKQMSGDDMLRKVLGLS